MPHPMLAPFAHLRKGGRWPKDGEGRKGEVIFHNQLRTNLLKHAHDDKSKKEI
jgi:hypothetical protein